MAQRDRSEYKREYNKRWYQANKEHVRERSKKWHQDNREASNASKKKYIASLRDLVNDHKKAGACIRCGIADYRVLDFHHCDPSQKKINLNLAWKQHQARQVILDEIAKCDLICSNCHRVLHWEERNGASL